MDRAGVMMEQQAQILPKGWIKEKLGNILPLSYGKALSGKNRDSSGAHPVYGSSGVVGHHTEYLIKKPSLIVGRKGSAGNVFYSEKPCWPIDTAYYSEESSLTELRYFLYLLSHIRLDQVDNSTAIPSLSRDVYNQIEVPFAPLNEQRRIVDKIETLFSDLDKGEENLRTAQRQLATYRQSVLKAAMSGELIGADSGVWPKQALGELITDIRYGTAKKCWHDPSKTAVLRIPNVVSGKIDLTNLKHTDFEPAEIKKLALKEGDVLLVRSNGSASLVGRSAVVGKEAEGCAYAGYLIRLRLKQDQILPNFLHLFLLSPGTRAHIERQARSTSGVHNINSDEVKSLSLSVPSIDEQMAILDKIEDIFSRISALEAWCATELTRSATLRQSILKAAFSGQLVPQDASDEPASELLKRIQSERANTPKAKPAAKRGRPGKRRAA